MRERESVHRKHRRKEEAELRHIHTRTHKREHWNSTYVA